MLFVHTESDFSASFTTDLSALFPPDQLSFQLYSDFLQEQPLTADLVIMEYATEIRSSFLKTARNIGLKNPLLIIASAPSPEEEEQLEKLSCTALWISPPSGPPLKSMFRMLESLIDAQTEKYIYQESAESLESELVDQTFFTDKLMDILPVPVYIKDSRGKYMGCNREFTRFTGLESDEILGKTAAEIYPGELAGVYHQKDLDLLKHSERQQYAFKMINHRNETRDVLFIKDVFSHRNEPSGIIGVYLDITDSKKFERQLRKNLGKMKVLIDMYQMQNMNIDQFLNALIDPIQNETESRCGCIAISAETGWEILEWDKSGSFQNERRFIKDLSELGEWYDFLIHPDHENHSNEHYETRKLLHIINDENGNLRIMGAGGKKKEPYNEMDHMQMNLYMEAITAKLDKDLYKKKMNEALAVQKSMYRELQHRIKNSFNMIQAIMKLEIMNEPDRVFQKKLQSTACRINSLSFLYENLQENDNAETLNIKKYFSEIIAHLRSIYTCENSHCFSPVFISEIDEGILPKDEALPAALILTEAVTNAVKYAFDENTGEINISLKNGSDFMNLSVSDNGKGFSPDQSRDESGRTSSSLGVMLMKQLANQLHGSFTIDSGAGGSTCSLKWPVNHSP